MSYYPETNIHIRDKIKVVLALINYATKTKLEDAIHVDTCNLTAEKDFITLNF